MKLRLVGPNCGHRGASWNYHVLLARLADRCVVDSWGRSVDLGLRLVRRAS